MIIGSASRPAPTARVSTPNATVNDLPAIIVCAGTTPQFSNPGPTAVAATATLLRYQFPVRGHKLKVTGQICGLFGRHAALGKPDKDLISGKNCIDENARSSRAFARGSSLGRSSCASKFGNMRLRKTRAARSHFAHCIMPPSHCSTVRKFALRAVHN